MKINLIRFRIILGVVFLKKIPPDIQDFWFHHSIRDRDRFTKRRYLNCCLLLIFTWRFDYHTNGKNFTKLGISREKGEEQRRVISSPDCGGWSISAI